MGWWTRFFSKRPNATLDGQQFGVAFNLYSKDGLREVEVREFRMGQTYVVEREQLDGAFVDRHSGRMVGPFATPEEAENFIVATDWFCGRPG